MVMKNAMNHKHSRGASFSRDTASDLRLEKASAPASGRCDAFAKPSGNDRCLRIPANWR